MAKSTVECSNGVVRRVDDLGRTVIAAEFRKMLNIKEGDYIEQFATDGQMVFRKFSAIATLEEIAKENAEVLHEMIGLPVLVADTDKVLIARGANTSEYLDCSLTREASNLIYKNKTHRSEESEVLQPIREMRHRVLLQVPIVSGDMAGGAIIVLATDEECTLFDNVLELTCMTAKLISSRMNWGFA